MTFVPPAGFAPFWKRAVAAVVDFILWTVAYYIIGVVALMAAIIIGGLPYSTLGILGSAIGFLTSAIVVGWLYNALLESSPWQATLGKMLMDIRVCDRDGEAIGFKRATGRYFAKFVSTLLLGLGFILPLFRPERQALHDRMARTLVINRF